MCFSRRDMTIRKAETCDAEKVNALAHMLFCGHDEGELLEEIKAMLESPEAAAFLAEDGENCVGVAECSLRHDYVEGTSGSPVGYLEGIYVLEGARRAGAARALVETAKDWARKSGAKEFASDCELDNEMSIRFHKALGFAEAGRIVCFTVKL